MTAMKRMMSCALGLFALAGGLQSPAKAQFAYTPEIGSIPTGATMSITPAVSADRRYVRLSVDAFFNGLNNIQTFSFPGGAVGGGNFGGFGGFGGGIAAGMNGVIGDEGYESGLQVANITNAPAQAQARQPGVVRAGAMPGDQAGALADALQNGAGMRQGQWGEFGFIPGFEDEAAAMMAMENGTGRGVRATGARPGRMPRRSSTRKATRSSRSSSSASRTQGNFLKRRRSQAGTLSSSAGRHPPKASFSGPARPARHSAACARDRSV